MLDQQRPARDFKQNYVLRMAYQVALQLQDEERRFLDEIERLRGLNAELEDRIASTVPLGVPI